MFEKLECFMNNIFLRGRNSKTYASTITTSKLCRVSVPSSRVVNVLVNGLSLFGKR